MTNYSKASKDYFLFAGKETIEYSIIVDWAFQFGIVAIIYKDEDGFYHEVSDDDYEYSSESYDDLIMCIADLSDLLFQMVEEALNGTDVFEDIYALKRTVQKLPANKRDQEKLIDGLFNAASGSWEEVNSTRSNFAEYREKCIDLCMFLLSTIYLHERTDQVKN